MAIQKDLSRRIVLANSLVGVGTLAMGAIGCAGPSPDRERQRVGASASPITTFQDNWWWCYKCSCLFFAGESTGTCPAGYGHDYNWSGQYYLHHDDSGAPGLANWFWCWKCQGLAWYGLSSPPSTVGSCPAGSGHERDGSGNYRIENVRPGTYSVTFTLPGFNTVKRDGIELAGSFVATVNADMKVGAIEETITVSAESPVVDVQNITTRTVMTRDGRFSMNENGELTPGAAASYLKAQVKRLTSRSTVELAIRLRKDLPAGHRQSPA